MESSNGTQAPAPRRSSSHQASFAHRHVGPRPDDQAKMLSSVGFSSRRELAEAGLPAGIRLQRPLLLPSPASEEQALSELRSLAGHNRVVTSMIGLGYHDTLTPAVIQRNVLENPAWYTAYTPYQPEISQGRLEALINFQTVVSDLTGLQFAGASLLDEATAAAEAMALSRRCSKSKSSRFVVDPDTHPQTLAVLRTRAEPVGIDVVVDDVSAALGAADAFGVLLSYPGSSGRIRNLRELTAAAQAQGALVTVATDLLALALLEPPGEWGADLAIGSGQRFGVPLGYGGPHAGFMAVRSGLERHLPGRLVGVSVDAGGAPVYRLALQTREQHIRREKATSNICTAQVLLAVVASMYAVYHGPEGITEIAARVHRHASTIASELSAAGLEVTTADLFDTLTVKVPEAATVVERALSAGINLRLVDDDSVSVACNERTTDEHVDTVLGAFGVERQGVGLNHSLPTELARTSPFLTHPVFSSHRSETAMMRYLRHLSDKDLALDRTMIPLGSCTMKLNAATEMMPITWPELSGIHPFAPIEQASGYLAIVRDLAGWLAEITGYDAVSLQPNAGSQGELAGLLAIRAFHRDSGNAHRTICLIPASAHGTNAASATMAGMQVVVVACDDAGNVSLADLRQKTQEHSRNLAALMVTYPSTHGVFEQGIQEICQLVHDAGGQVYVDGANLNALVGLAQFGRFGADVSHLNLHKTFCIPHGGGGPGVGPVAVRSHLQPYLPNHPLLHEAGPETGIGPVSGAPFGSAGILPIAWAYIRMMGAEGLTEATEVAILSANYIARRLSPYYPVLYTGAHGLVAHECILDLRAITRETGVTAEDVAKRLIDYGLHAPTMSFPVSGTLMVEPTESEGLEEIDRFCEAMIAIRGEIDRVASSEWPIDDCPLRNAPHPAEALVHEWTHPYSRETAVFPVPDLPTRKYWPPVRRIDQGYGDRNLACTCPPLSEYT